MKFIEVGKYSEKRCASCDMDDWGAFLELPSGRVICNECLDNIVIEIKVEDLRNKLKSKPIDR